jgi:uncharacterized membrane protein YwaF
MNIYTFDLVWWGLLAAIAAVCLLVWLLFRRRSEDVRARAVALIGAFNLLLFCFYKYWLSQDPAYLLANGFPRFEPWLELPLQLCNINLLLIPLALALRREGFYTFCFYTASLGAFMAIASPPASFEGDIFLLRNIGFYGTHALLIVCGVSLMTLRFVKPRQRDVLWTVSILALVACAIHGLNTLIQHAFGVEANYFYTYGPGGSSILSNVYAILPMPLAYLFLLIIGIVPAAMLLTALINLPTWLKKRRGSTQASKS